jgi:F0F1-type ATP synthase membrane subunit b/b'
MSPSWLTFNKTKIKFKGNASDHSEDLRAIGETLREAIGWGYTDGLRDLRDVSEHTSLSLPETVQKLAQEYERICRMYQSLQEQKGKVDEDLRRTQSSLRMAKDKLTEGERSHSSEMDSARRESNSLLEKMDSARREFTSLLEDARQKHEQARMHMEAEHQRRVESLLEDSRQKMDSARREFTSLLEDARQKHEQARMHMEAEHRRRVERLSDEAEQNEHNHQQETARLNKIIHGRTKAIVTRETFTPITDRDLKTKFTELYSKVDSLGKLQWSPGRSTWRDDQLRQVRVNSKKLQKSIIQETVWLVLHEYILCSPFRVFGKEGKIMEKQWNDAYGNGPYANPCDGPVLTMDRRI